MKMLISGGTGMIGHALAELWLAEGHEVIIVTRSKTAPKRVFPDRQPRYASWSELKSGFQVCQHVDVAVNLAGESINQRWTESAKNRIIASRLMPAKRFQDWASGLSKKLPLYISASGISIYGSSYAGVFDETSDGEGNDFLSDVVRQWEEGADSIPSERTVKLRIAPVLASDAGAYPSMLLPFKLFCGGSIGNGKQPFSWIHLDDVIRAIDFIAKGHDIDGIVNASAPEAVTNEQFGRILAKVYGRPYWLPIPAFMLKVILGEMSTMLLDGQRVYPAKLLEHGFTFQHGTVEGAVRNLHNLSIAKKVKKEAPAT